jgi:hypothetical protein
MSQKGRRRLGSLRQESPDAAKGLKEYSPSDREALAALHTLRAWLGGPRTAHSYDQRTLPPDAKSVDAYMRRHRALRAAGIAGVWTRGKILACTAEAWATELPRTPRLAVVAPTPDVDAQLDAELGIRTRRRA